MFLQELQKGLEGRNMGLSTGIPPLDRAINGIQRRKIIGVAAPSKVGKTTLVDAAFLLEPYLKYPDAPIDWIYWSGEISRIEKEFKFAAYFMARDFNISTFEWKGATYEMESSYLQGKKTDEQGEFIKPSQDHVDKVKLIYEQRIVPLFGRYDERGNKVQNGRIDFIEERDNPTGMYHYLMSYADKNGKFTHENYIVNTPNGQETRRRVSGYIPNNPDKYTIVIVDHIRKPKIERGFTLKQNIDKLVEYMVELRNWCGFTFIPIIHVNRNLSQIDRLKYGAEYLYPTGDDIKDSGNLSEEADYLLTMFNANDDRYNLSKHFGLVLEGRNKELLYPNYRSIHLVDSRDTPAPQHIKVSMLGGINRIVRLFDNYGNPID